MDPAAERIQYADLVDSIKLQALMDSLSQVIGTANAVIDVDGNVIAHAGWQDACVKFHRANPESCRRCLESDTVLADSMTHGLPFAFYRCHNGLVDAAAPIVVGGVHVANLFTGQFLTAAHDPEFFRQQARLFGFDQENYLQAISRVPVLSAERVEAVTKLYAHLAAMMADCGMTILRQNQAAQDLTLQSRRAEALLALPKASEILDETAFMQYGQELAEDLTGSQISFIHFVNDNEETIELVTWSKRTLERYCNAVFDLHYPVSQAGIWAEALRQKMPVTFNDYAAYPHKQGLPEGHATLKRLISVPVVENGKVVMLAGVGNKAGDYSDMDVETVQLVASEVWRIVQRKRAEKANRQGHATLQSILETTRDGYWRVDDSGRLLDVNDGYARQSGYTKEELLQMHITDLEAGENAGETADRIEKAIQIGGDLFESRHRRKDGSIWHVEVSTTYRAEARQFVTFLRDITERKLAEEALQASHVKLQELLAYQERVKENERIRIAREIHDELGSGLTAVKANLSVAMHEQERAGYVPSQRLADACDILDSVIDTMRKVITDLRPSVLDQLGVWAALEWYAEQTQARTGIRCRIAIEPAAAKTECDAERSTALFRILQESLTNVVRHADATEVEIRVTREDSLIKMIVEDNGKGINARLARFHKSWGIDGMAERARYFGGDIRIADTSHGTLLVLRLPLARAEGFRAQQAAPSPAASPASTLDRSSGGAEERQ